jgi:hypothetical protein
MKFSAILLASVSANFASESFSHPRRVVVRDTSPDNAERRMAQLTQMMKHYNPDFDERKHWGYGCHTMFLGDRPMSERGAGVPKDAFDKVGKEYKDCLKCAADKHGETCIPEFMKYDLTIQNGVEVRCPNKKNTCERILCECDKAYAQSAAQVLLDPSYEWSEEYHYFSDKYGDKVKSDGQMDVEAIKEEMCPPGESTGEVDPACCTNARETKPYRMYNKNKQQCCTYTGDIIPNGGICA